ncbi:MAG: sigma-70 family RNA polymerase sigma factor [Actinomycetota bacterium]|nr:sigma-70 family RNA polymerase sigma factor [Actinomycetota bacterium]
MPGRAEFEDVFEGLFVAAYRVAYRILDNAGEAEDTAAEATARALDGWRKVGAMPSPTSWVVRVATNLAIDIVRRRRFVAVGDAEALTEPDEAETRIVVREMLRRLPRRQRDVLALRYLADLSEADIAEVLGISPGSVKRHASRAIERLRRHDPKGAVSYAV